MNITSVEVSTPFFHENNTVAMNSYEAPVQSGLAETAILVEPVQSRPVQWCPCEAVQSEAAQSETSPVQSEAGQSEATPMQSPEENTLAYVMQTSINHAVRMKEYYEECACGYRCFATYGSILCGAIWNNVEQEYEKLAKSKEIMMQQIRPIAPMETEDTHPISWRWENRTAILLEGGVWGERKSQIFYQGRAAEGGSVSPQGGVWVKSQIFYQGRAAEGGSVSPQERGACLLYRPVAYMLAFDEHNFDHRTVDRYNFDPNTFNQHVIDQHMSRQTPVCLLRENDVVDNGTVMCLRAFKTECFYGNETMKAILEIDKLYCSENTGMFSSTTWLILIVLFFVVGALTRKAN